MSTKLLPLVERVRLALEGPGVLGNEALESLLEPGEDRALLEAALAFLQGRDEILVDVRDPSIHLRRKANDAVIRSLAGSAAPLRIDDLARSAGLPMALCCDVLGWLEREGRIVIDADGAVSLH